MGSKELKCPSCKKDMSYFSLQIADKDGVYYCECGEQVYEKEQP